MSEKSGIDLISFLQDHTQLFTITALFAALSYYLANLLIAPRNEYLSIVYDYSISLSQVTEEEWFKDLFNQYFSLQIAVVICFLIFGILILLIIFQARNYDLLTKAFALLLGFLLYFSLSYFFSTYKDFILIFSTFFIPFLMILIYWEVFSFFVKKYKETSSFPIGFWSILVLDILLIAFLIVHLFLSYLSGHQIPTDEFISKLKLAQNVELALILGLCLFFGTILYILLINHRKKQ